MKRRNSHNQHPEGLTHPGRMGGGGRAGRGVGGGEGSKGKPSGGHWDGSTGSGVLPSTRTHAPSSPMPVAACQHVFSFLTVIQSNCRSHGNVTRSSLRQESFSGNLYMMCQQVSVLFCQRGQGLLLLTRFLAGRIYPFLGKYDFCNLFTTSYCSTENIYPVLSPCARSSYYASWFCVICVIYLACPGI